ncbi:hypothetical protein U1Q18_003362 [Sarracenia purpurea var. burkii]
MLKAVNFDCLGPGWACQFSPSPDRSLFPKEGDGDAKSLESVQGGPSEVLPGVPLAQASGSVKGVKTVDSDEPDVGALEEEPGITPLSIQDYSEPSHQVKSSVLCNLEPAFLQTQICSDLVNDDPSAGVVSSNYTTVVDTLKVIGAEINQLGKKMQSLEHALKMFDILPQPNPENEYGAEGMSRLDEPPEKMRTPSFVPSVLDKGMARVGNPYVGDGNEEGERLSDETDLKTVSGNKSKINQVSLTESNIVSLPNEAHGVNLSIVSGLADESAKVEFRIDAQCHVDDGAQEVFDKRGVLPAVHHRKDADVQPAGSAKIQLGRPVSSLGDQVGYLAPRLSPTTQASLLIHAVESLGKSGLG